MILLDTHVVVWLAGEEHRLSRKAQTAIDEARQTEQGLGISDFTIYELSTLFRKKQFSLVISPESFLFEVERRFVVLPITSRICVGALSLPAAYPKDPADRIIGATALVEGLTLVTADAQIRNSRAIPTIW
ncbi:MAG TPA: type II toxin-antitoxin system VapC family toxin [Candidatus Sulfotelmatobacter sp.]